MSGRMRSKEEREFIRARIVALHSKEPELTRAAIAERCGCKLDMVVTTLKAAKLYEPRVGGRRS